MTRIIKNGSSTTRDLKPARERPDYPSSQKRKAAIKLFEMGVGYKNAANILGLSVYTVRDWLRDFRKGTFKVELNVNQFRYAQETKDRVIALRKEGFSWSEYGARVTQFPRKSRRPQLVIRAKCSVN